MERLAFTPLRACRRRGANLGYYTNFVNLFDPCALAVPAAFSPAGFPFGITLIAPAFADRALD